MGYQINITGRVYADSESMEDHMIAVRKAVSLYNAMSEAIGLHDGEEEDYDIEWIGPGDEPSFWTSSHEESCQCLEAVTTEHQMHNLTQAEDWSVEDAERIIEEWERRRR